MYEAYYGLHERPFDLTPNPRFLFMTPGHREALSTIQYGISGRKGVTLLLGPAGTGKTTLVNAALERQGGKNARAVFLTNPTLTREELFDFLAHELHLSDAAKVSKPQFLRELTATLLTDLALGVVTALIVDEAQALPDQLLEEVRLLANMETPTEKLLPVVLVGQPELADRLNRKELQQFKQRVALRSNLSPLSAHDTVAYVAERIRIAGGDVRAVFTPEAVAAVYECSGGIPRTISVVCDNALVNGFALDERPVGRAVIADVCRDFDLPVPRAEQATDQFVEIATAMSQPNPGAAASGVRTAPQAAHAREKSMSLVLAPPADVLDNVPASVLIEPVPVVPPPPPRGLRRLLMKVGSR